ncbi:MAG: YARHG domain-containing protein [Pseudomonadota bacterium]
MQSIFPFLWEKIKNLSKWPIILIFVSLFAFFGEVAKFRSNITELWNSGSAYIEKRAYLNNLKAPFKRPATREELQGMTTGELQLRILRIKAYQGELKFSENVGSAKSFLWLKKCLSNTRYFPDGLQSVNELHEFDMVDWIAQDRSAAAMAYDQKKLGEDRSFFRLPGLRSRILARASSQLLYGYYDSEIVLVDQDELYFIRNAIYASKGYRFSTHVLRKFFNRDPKYRPVEGTFKFTEHISPVELCNAEYLRQLNTKKVRNSVGRGLSIIVGDDEVFSDIRSRTCVCLQSPGISVDCHRPKPDEARGETARRYVDMIIELGRGENTYGFDYPEASSKLQRTYFYELEKTSLIAAIERIFHEVHLEVLSLDPKLHFKKQPLNDRAKHLGVRIEISDDLAEKLGSSVRLRQDVSAKMCRGIDNFFDKKGDLIPQFAD